MKAPCKFMNAQQWICYLYSMIQELELEDIWKLSYPAVVDLEAAFPVGEKAWFAFVEDTNSFWYWSETLNQWVNQNITVSDYELLTADDKASVPYIIIP